MSTVPAPIDRLACDLLEHLEPAGPGPLPRDSDIYSVGYSVGAPRSTSADDAAAAGC